MKVVIIGGGEVGFHVAKALSEEDYDITVIDLDPVKCRRASENLDVIVVEGNGASPNTLNDAKVGEADFVLCLTRVDEVNLIASQQSHKLGANKIIARLRNQQYTTKESIIRPEKFGVDIIIHPEKAACEEITRLVKHPYAVQVMDFESRRLTMLGLKIDLDCENMYDKPLGEIARDNHHFRFGVVAILRGQETIVPSADFVFRSGDIAYFVIKTEDIPNLMDLLCKELTETHRVMILGGGKIGRTLAKELPSDSINVRLVDYNRLKAGQISQNIDESMILHGDGTDIEFLKSENIQKDEDVTVVVEQVNAMPGQGVTSMFNFGQTFGALKGICAALELPIFFVRPSKWKKHFELINSSKDASRTKAIEMYPKLSSQLSKKKDVNKSDAILIARFFSDTRILEEK